VVNVIGDVNDFRRTPGWPTTTKARSVALVATKRALTVAAVLEEAIQGVKQDALSSPTIVSSFISTSVPYPHPITLMFS
jgi:hypothetical protein